MRTALILLALTVVWVGVFAWIMLFISMSSLAEGPETWEPTAAKIALIFFPTSYLGAAWLLLGKRKPN